VRHPRVHLHFTPTYSSWLNLVERWFAELTAKWLKRGTHRSVAELTGMLLCLVKPRRLALEGW
jgi:transposase